MEPTIRHDGENHILFNVDGFWTENDTLWVEQYAEKHEQAFDDAEILACYKER